MRARSDDGAFESDERVRVAGPVVEFSEHGARVLADRYWLEVERVSRRVVVAKTHRSGSSCDCSVAGRACSASAPRAHERRG